MTFSSYYHNLPPSTHPRTELVTRLAQRCEVNMETVRTWIRGDRLPSRELYYDIISEETGIPKEQLFAHEIN